MSPRDYANNCGAKDRRASQWLAMDTVWRASGLERVRKCRKVTHGEHVGVVVRPGGRAHYSGLVTCGSLWACPTCSAKIEAERGDELAAALRAWNATGGTVALLTLTMRHDRGQGLAELWDALSDAWRAASGAARGRVQTEMREAGVAGWVRKVEVTYGANGWHVHVHAFLFIEPDAPRRLPELGGAVFEAWSRRLQARGLAAPIANSGGLDLREVNLREALSEAAGYLAKGTYDAALSNDPTPQQFATDQAKRAARELTGQASKQARGGNRTPFGILADLGTFGLADDFAAWREWEAASLGRRGMTWSKGMRDRLGLDQERDDEAIAAETDGAGETVALLTRRQWASVRRAGPLAIVLLEVVEADPGYDTVAEVLNAWGVGAPLRPPQAVDDVLLAA